MRKVLSYLAVVLFLIFSWVNQGIAASNLEEGVKELADKISKSMLEKQKQKIAIIDFSDLNGNVTALGQFMAEELTTQLFMIAPGKFEVVERRQIMKLEEELVLGQVGIIEEKGIKKMGQVLGVDAIVTGSMTDLGNTVKINARLIGVDSAKVFAVAATDIPKTGMVADLIGKQVEGKQASVQNKSKASEPAKNGTTTETLQKVKAKGFTFELQGCEIAGGTVTCNLLVTNKEKDRNLSLFGGVCADKRIESRIFDEAGNEYHTSQHQLGNKTNKGEYGIHCEAESLLVSGIPTKAVLTFEGISPEPEKMSLLEVYGRSSGSDNFKVQFRNIPLSR